MIFESLLTSEDLKHVAKILMNLAENIDTSPVGDGTKTTSRTSNERTLIERALPFLTSVARDEYCARRERNRHMDPALFGELNWDILLDLFVHHGLGKKVSVTSACIASAGPPTTALRHLNLLQELGYITREVSKVDKRVAYVSLSEKGIRDIAAYLAARAKVRLRPDQSELNGGFMLESPHHKI